MKFFRVLIFLASIFSFVSLSSDCNVKELKPYTPSFELVTEDINVSLCSFCRLKPGLNDFKHSGLDQEYHAKCLHDYFCTCSFKPQRDDVLSCGHTLQEHEYIEFIKTLLLTDFPDEIRYIPGLSDRARTDLWIAILKSPNTLKLIRALKFGLPTNGIVFGSSTLRHFICLAGAYASPANLTYIISNFKDQKIIEGFTLAITKSNFTNAKILLDFGADINHVYKRDQSTLLSASIRRGAVSVVKFLVENNADVNLASAEDGSPLHLAIATDNVEIAKILVKSGRVDFRVFKLFKFNTEPQPFEFSHVTFAALQGKLKTLSFLLDNGAPTKVAYMSLLQFTIVFGPLESVQFLLKRRFQAITEDGEVSYFLHLATLKDRTEIVNYLLRYAGANFYEICLPKYFLRIKVKEKGDRFHPTDPAIVVAMLRGNFELFKIFLDAGMCPNTRISDSTRSLLHLAFEICNVKMAHYLISIGADLNCVDSKGLHPYTYNTKQFLNSVIDYSD